MLVSCGKKGNSASSWPLIAISSELGNRDAQVAQMKGALLSINPSVRLVDLSHENQGNNLLEASYLFDKTVASFPSGTLFIMVMDAGNGSSHKPVLILTQAGKYLIGPDNGIFTHVVGRELVDQAIQLENADYFRPGGITREMQGRDIFGPVAAHLAAGTDPAKFGPRLKEITRLKNISPTTLGNKTNGMVIHADRNGNLLTNIRAENISTQSKGKLLKISFKGKTVSCPYIQSAAEAPANRLYCLINADGEFEIKLREGSAAASTGLKAGEPIVIQH